MNTRKIIITLCFLVALMFQWMTNVEAVPHLQLYIPGATYDNSSQTWVYQYASGTPFTLQVIGANDPINNVYVSMALMGIAQGADLSSVSMSFDSANYTGSNFIWGQPAKLQPPHSVFPAYYAEHLAGNFGLVETVYDMQPGETGTAQGQIKNFSVTINGTISGSPFDVHFDAYDTYVQGGKLKAVFAPFSHDGEGTGEQPIPEPATIALLSIGIISLLGYKGRNFLKKA